MHDDAPVETALLRDCPIAHPGPVSAVIAIHAITLTLPLALTLATLQVLDAAEQRRWNGMHRPDDRDRFATSRALAKAVIALPLGRHPRSVTVTSVPGRRPQVVGIEACRLSISHTRDLVVVACCLQGEIGVDCEYIDRDLDTAALARRFFGAAEHHELSRLEGRQHSDGFFRLWTGKEALAKASGAGLDEVLNADLHDLLVPPHQAHSGAWAVRSLPPIGDSAVAIAAAGSAWLHDVRRWDACELLHSWRG